MRVMIRWLHMRCLNEVVLCRKLDSQVWYDAVVVLNCSKGRFVIVFNLLLEHFIWKDVVTLRQFDESMAYKINYSHIHSFDPVACEWMGVGGKHKHSSRVCPLEFIFSHSTCHR